MVVYKHVSVGNINLDIVLYVHRYPESGDNLVAVDMDIRPGGSASNYAVAVAQYGHKAYLVASASSSQLGKIPLEVLKAKNVDLSFVKTVDQLPGMVIVIVDSTGERTMISYPGANSELSPSDIPYGELRDMHILHLASIPADKAMEIAKKARHLDILITYDPGARSESLLGNLELLEYVDILFINKKELGRVIHEERTIDILFKRGLQVLVVKLGEKGAVVYSSSGICLHGYTIPVKKPVDSTGAGDAFDALFNAKYIESKDLSLALRYGVAAGALKVGYKGSMFNLDQRLFSIQLDKTQVERTSRCDLI